MEINKKFLSLGYVVLFVAIFLSKIDYGQISEFIENRCEIYDPTEKKCGGKKMYKWCGGEEQKKTLRSLMFEMRLQIGPADIISSLDFCSNVDLFYLKKYDLHVLNHRIFEEAAKTQECKVSIFKQRFLAPDYLNISFINHEFEHTTRGFNGQDVCLIWGTIQDKTLVYKDIGDK